MASKLINSGLVLWAIEEILEELLRLWHLQRLILRWKPNQEDRMGLDHQNKRLLKALVALIVLMMYSCS